MAQLKVDILTPIEGKLEDSVAGSITWNGKNFQLFGNGPLMHNILSARIHLGDKMIDKSNPEDFMHSLHLHYKSPYLRATEAEDTGPVQMALEKDAAEPLADQIIRRGLSVGIAVSEEVKRQVREQAAELVKKKSPTKSSFEECE